MGWFKDITKDSISGVVVALVTGGSGVALIYWLWSYVKKGFYWILNCLTYSVTTPVWILFIFSLLLMALLPTIAFLIRRRINSKKNAQPDNLLKYTKDNIFEMVVTWRWVKYIGSKGYTLDGLEMRCPVCGGLLNDHVNMERLHQEPFPIIKCKFEGCDWKIANNMKHTTFGDMRHKLKNEIDRRCFQKFGN